MSKKLPAVGSIMRITKRKIKGDKVQPYFKTGSYFYVQAHGKLQQGKVDVLIVQHPKNSKRSLRCNSARFEWEEMTPTQIQELKFAEKVVEDTKRLRDGFSFEEHMQIAFVPLVITHLAWKYADSACDRAAGYRIEQLKKLTRAVRMMHKDYDSTIARDLNLQHRKEIEREAERFADECARDFKLMWWTVSSEVLKNYQHADYKDMRTDAAISELLCDYYIQHNKRMDALIEERLGNGLNSIADPKMVALKDCMNAFVGDVDLPRTELINRCMAIFKNNLHRIDFQLTDGEQERTSAGSLQNH